MPGSNSGNPLSAGMYTRDSWKGDTFGSDPGSDLGELPVKVLVLKGQQSLQIIARFVFSPGSTALGF